MTKRASAVVLLAWAAAAVAARAVATQVFELPLSEKECWEPEDPPETPPDARTAWCHVTNLYLYRGTAYFVTNGALRQLPTVQYGRPRITRTVTPEGFQALVAPGAEVRAVEQAYVMRSVLLQGVKRHLLQSTWVLVASEASVWAASPALLSARRAGGVQGKACTAGDSYVNFGDGMTERIATLWMFLCEELGHCSYADRSQLQLIDAVQRKCRPGDPPSGWDTYPPWYQEVLSCISDQPLRHLNGTWRDAVVHVRSAWLGQGRRCRSHYGHCHDGSRGKQPPTPRLLRTWRDTLGACLGFSTAQPAPLDPVRVMIVDRTYESQRHLLNVNTLLRALRRRYSEQRVEVSLQYMEDLSVAQQFRLWAQQTVVVHVHGSNIGHWQGLPHGAVVIKIAPFKDTYSDDAYGSFLARDYGPVNNLTWLPLVNVDPNYLHKATEHRPLTDPRYKRYTDAEKLALLRADCGAVEEGEKRKVCERALKFNMNLVVKPEALAAKVDEAIQAAFAKQGRRVPPDLLAAAGAGAGGGAAGGGVTAAGGRGGAAGEEIGRAGAAADGAAAEGVQRSQQQQQEEQEQQQQLAFQPTGAAMQGGLHLSSLAVGAAAASAFFLLARSRRCFAGRRKPAAPGHALFGKSGSLLT